MKCKDCAYFSYLQTPQKVYLKSSNSATITTTKSFDGCCKEGFTNSETQSCECFMSPDERTDYEEQLFSFLQKELSDYYEDFGDDLTIIEIPQKEIGNNKYDFNI